MFKDNYKKYKQLRKDYKFFIYEGFSIKSDKDKISVIYEFNLADKFYFYPSIEIIKGNHIKDELNQHEISNFAFHIGMIELISYWKAACPKLIIVKPYKLNDSQIAWWKNLYFNGMGEFFYLNNIHDQQDEIMEIICESEKEIIPFNLSLENNQVLVPIGGGKDSIVTLELLKDHFGCIPMVINPRPASLNTMNTASFKSNEFIEIKRTIHPQLLELNEKGFLNGHTPFSAMLAFVSIFIAALNGSKHIALSNESSANESTHLESGVNHQYSKSFEFENNFREYVSKYISPDINYFSFLRPLNEYKIAEIFSGFLQYFKNFRSCNVGSKSDSWCGKCPKCLFTYIILSPFLGGEQLIQIFGKDLYLDEDLLSIFKELTGLSEVKPFECVGTIDEVNLALNSTIRKYKCQLPYLLEFYKSSPNYHKYQTIDENEFLQSMNEDHFLDSVFLDIIHTQFNA